MSRRLLDPIAQTALTVMADTWHTLADCEDRVPPALRPWLAEPGLLTARVREACGNEMSLRMIRLETSRLEPVLQHRLGVTDADCLQRDVEIGCARATWVFARSLFPATTVGRYPWLRELGDTGLGEQLAQVEYVRREPLEYRELDAGHPLLQAAAAAVGPMDGPLWARRAVYRLGGCPILVQEVFLPALALGADS
jgi:chorismate--pyruvate lyase